MDEKGTTHICEASPVLLAEPRSDAAAPTYLIVLRGGIPGAMLPVAVGENWIGRASDSTVQLSDSTVSRHHAVLVAETNGRVTLIDRGSTNGSYVNNRRLDPNQPIVLNDGDRLRIGSMVVLKFSRPDPCEEDFQRELFERSVRDHLTGLYNRVYLLDQMDPLARNAAREGLGVAVLMLDVDHFKRINDTYGHDVGDVVLREVAAVIRQKTRSEDLVARYGGEEFVVVLPCVSIGRAVERAERIRRRLAARRVRVGDGALRLTASIGVAFASAGRPKPPPALISTADLHLYQAKESGRNCVVCFLTSPAVTPDGQLTTDGELPTPTVIPTDPAAPTGAEHPAFR